MTTGLGPLPGAAALWMIRKKTNDIIGPVNKEQILEMVNAGHLERDDELCPENGYWFYLHEVAEVRAKLGIDHVFVRRSTGGASPEATLTEDTLTAELSGSGIAQGESPTMQIKRPISGPTARPITSAIAAELQSKPPLTADELVQQFQRPASAILGGSAVGAQAPSAKGSNLERSRLWMLIVAGGIILCAWGVLKILDLLKRVAGPLDQS